MSEQPEKPGQPEPSAAGPAATPEKTGAPPASHWEVSPPQIHRYPTPDDVADAAAHRFVDCAERAVEQTDRFIVVLAGGSTPRLLYEKLNASPYRESIPWDRTYFVFGDERCVPPDHPDSNYRMVHETLLEPLEISPERVLRMKGEQAPADAARRYEVRLGDLFLNHPKRRFDLLLLGLGTDGHTASLFPGTAALDEQQRWVAANHVPQLDAWRLTLTFPALNAAKRVVFLATGETKAQIVAEAFGGVEHEGVHPCERVAPVHVKREVLIDRAAATALPG